MDEHNNAHLDDHDPTVHHEETDVDVSAILKFIVVFVILTGVIFVGLWLLFRGFQKWERKKDVAVISEVPDSLKRQYPPAPHLQPFPESEKMGGRSSSEKWVGLGSQLSSSPTNDPTRSTPAYDMEEMHKQQSEEVNSYGWVDRKQGIVRIPISEAKKLLLQQGLPVRQEPLPAAGGQAPSANAAGLSQQPTNRIGSNQQQAAGAVRPASAAGPTGNQ